MQLMSSRQNHLDQALSGLDQGLPPLVGYANGDYFPVAYNDDLGLFYIVPKVAHLLSISTSSALNLVFYSSMIVAFLIAAWVVMQSAKTKPGQFVGILALALLFRLTTNTTSISLFMVPFIVGVIPLFLFLLEKSKAFAWQLMFMTGVGLLAFLLNSIRSHAATGVLLFVVTLLLAKRLPWKRVSGLLLGLIVGYMCLLPMRSHVIYERDRFLADKGHQGEFQDRHVFWHTVYIGLGYVENSHGISYDDSVGFHHAKKIDEDVVFCSNEYEEILKGLIVGFLSSDPFFLVRAFLVKLGVVLLVFLFYANFGLLSSFYYRKPLYVDICFLLCAGFYSLFGIVAVPRRAYLIGLVAVATIYGINSLIWAFNDDLWDRLKEGLRKRSLWLQSGGH